MKSKNIEPQRHRGTEKSEKLTYEQTKTSPRSR